ncbi:MAG: GNAT family N-acetyltransferase [Cypionkella sp.]
MRDAVKIRRAAQADLPALLGMVEALTLYHSDAPRLTLETLTRDIFGAQPWFHVLVADAGAELLGYAATLPLARLGYGERGMDLHHLFVVEPARGHGIGTALVRACEAMARDMGCVYLIIGTHPGNRAAQAYYQKLGYGQMPATSVRFTRRLD